MSLISSFRGSAEQGVGVVLESLNWFRSFAEALGVSKTEIFAGTACDGEPQIDDAALRRALLSDPALAALWPFLTCCFESRPLRNSPFRLVGENCVVLEERLLCDPPALAAAARWGWECVRFQVRGVCDEIACKALANFGRGLLQVLPMHSVRLLCDILPLEVVSALKSPADATLTACAASRWLRDQLQNSSSNASAPSRVVPAMCIPVERLLLSGGDTRLLIDSETGLNRYGVPPRPRQHAILFSSSTASSISEHGFLLCEMLRQFLQFALGEGEGDAAVLRRLVDATGRAILNLLGLDEHEADVAIVPSGTDSELLSVLLACSSVPSCGVSNVIVAPEEVGRGTALAAAGCRFDSLGPDGAQVELGTSVWMGINASVVGVSVRDANGHLRPEEAVGKEFLGLCRDAISQGRRVLAHMVFCSKTGVEAPAASVIDDVLAQWPDQVDVVLDACQLRADFDHLGDWVRKGCMVQVTGSKFLTGPPFSGALVVPGRYRSRDLKLKKVLQQSSTVSAMGDWFKCWPDADDVGEPVTGFGPVFRWLPALAEARLFQRLPKRVIDYAFDRFRQALIERVMRANAIRLIDVAGVPQDNYVPPNYILSFEILGTYVDGTIEALRDADCQNFFELLNRNCADLPAGWTKEECELVCKCVHLGQPVTLGHGPKAVTVLRFVLGARFFNTVGHAPEDLREAALESEIADAKYAIDKIELLAARWWRIAPMACHKE